MLPLPTFHSSLQIMLIQLFTDYVAHTGPFMWFTKTKQTRLQTLKEKPAAQQKGGSRGSREHRQGMQESAIAIEAHRLPAPGPRWFMNYFYISQGFLFVIKLTFQGLISQKSKIGKSLIDKLLRNVYNCYSKNNSRRSKYISLIG